MRRWGNISRRKSSGHEENTFFELCCAGPNSKKAVKNAAQSPGPLSQTEFLDKGAEPQTVEQCASHAVVATLVREFGVPHDARENAAFDVSSGCVGADVSSGAPLRVLGASVTPSRCVPKCGQRDSDQTADVDGELHVRNDDAAAGVSGRAAVHSLALQGASLLEAVVQKTVQMVILLEPLRCGRFLLVQPNLQELVFCGRVVEDTLQFALVFLEQALLAAGRGSSALGVRRVAGFSDSLVSLILCRHLTVLTMRIHEVLVVHVVLITRIHVGMHAPIHVGTHTLRT